MKSMFKHLMLITSLFLTIRVNAQWSEIRSVDAWVEVNSTNNSLNLKWINQDYYTGCQIQRRNFGDQTSWGTVLVNLNVGDTTWNDPNVLVGNAYEYRILCNTNRPDPNTNNTRNVVSRSYLLSGIERSLTHRRGNMALVIETSIAAEMEDELKLLAGDLASDGWTVHKIYASKDTTAAYVKSLIQEVHNGLQSGLQAVYLFGHVPVPYSGNFNTTYYPPDAHVPDHNGAWAADVYYGTLNSSWTDNITNETGINREANKNRPGDGKWDQSQIPGTVELQVGRVDLFDMPAFGKTEVELLKQYIQKSHDFRFGITPTIEKALIDDNFKSMAEGFSTTAWTNFAAMFGPQNITTTDFLTTLKDSSYLMAYGCGAGSYKSCNGIGNTAAVAAANGAVFNFLFGSYFGDWDNRDNFLRAPLACEKLGLTNAWSGRPFWHAHNMALGGNIGETCLLTQNNIDENNNYVGMNFRKTVHIALMGDPTLRMHVVQPPSALQLTPEQNGSRVKIEWTASLDPDVYGYFVYRGKKSDSTFNLVLNGPVINNSFIDDNPYDQNSYYMVRAAKIQKSSSGSYHNLSQGIVGFVDNLTGSALKIETPKTGFVRMMPNPAQNQLSVYMNNTNARFVEVFATDGRLIMQVPMNTSNGRLDLNVSHLPEGIYLLRCGSAHGKFVVAR